MIKENCKLALLSIKANKMRAFLTMLGIIIGVAAVIAIMTVGNSMTKGVQKQLESYGVQNITIYVNPIDYNQELSEADYQTMKITPETLHKLANQFKGKISAISVEASAGSGTVIKDANKVNVEITGVSAGYFKANNIKLKGGNLFNEFAYEQGKNTAIVADKFAEQLFGANYSLDDVLGKEFEVNINDEYMNITVIGVYEYQQSGSMMRGSNKNISTNVYIPLKTAWNYSHDETIFDATVVAAEGQDPVTLSSEIKTYLTDVMANTLGDKFYIDAYSNQTMIQENTKTMNQMTLAISMIAAIALIVGGIGVMNIMTVSITERTKEIGTRKALGAPDGMIMLQFISEAIIICLIGGVIGIVVGLLLGNIAAHFMGYTPEVSIASIYMSVGFSMAIGVFFGYSPAKHAANMNPIDALRYE
ncbi:putative ABC transport system permease protein [Pseudobutyrivibrio ruminis]|uniref:Putative ABC transport system permease protein n=1 Tax=Pseudobutyrivibrio ruminis TaxID=46206 RepID=A0A1H7LGG8_9FIRM|nr:ABC transporter permease [Pseudobutyrivibrio ruminis]SEK98023.1 putative ABC transport system permease protein [Pseudobutyrivibrio ruminis]